MPYIDSNMIHQEFKVSKSEALTLARFREMDYYAVKQFNLPIELMMENAGLHLANLISMTADNLNAKILIGVGNGNNGGGGLVAARRLLAWGYEVYLDLWVEIDKELPKRQLERALKFGARIESHFQPDIWVDSYLGFSQRLPLPEKLRRRIKKANESPCTKVSLDIPTGFLGNIQDPHFKSDKVLSLAAHKEILFSLPISTEIFIADLGIPKEIYEKFGTKIPPFQLNNIIRVNERN